MGGTQSRNEVNIFMNALNKVVSENIQNCGSKITSNQVIKITGDGNIISNVKLKSAIVYNVQCDQLVTNITNMQNKIVNDIAQKAESLSQQFQLSSADSINIANLDLQVRNVVSLKNIQNIMTEMNASQGIFIDGNFNILESANLDYTGTIFAKGMQNLFNKIDAVNDIKNVIDQYAKSETENMLAFLTKWLETLMPAIIIGIILIAAMMFGRKKNTAAVAAT